MTSSSVGVIDLALIIDLVIDLASSSLCEKLLIARANSATLLNKRDELVSRCRHMNKFTLKCFKNR